jgi:L-ascorbate metabolism protein UlaG (beta-lactamase superfamily)
MSKLTFHGHSCFTLETNDGTILLIDPFLTGNPLADIGPDDVVKADYVLFTHGHGDHIGDGFEIARRTGATVISTFEIESRRPIRCTSVAATTSPWATSR